MGDFFRKDQIKDIKDDSRKRAYEYASTQTRFDLTKPGEIDKFLSALKERMSIAAEQRILENAANVAEDIKKVHHDSYDFQIMETRDENRKSYVLFPTSGDEAIKWEFGYNLPAWRETYAKYRAGQAGSARIKSGKGRIDVKNQL